MTKYQSDLLQRKLYDQHEKKYIEKELLKKELEDQYESSDSEVEGDYELVEELTKQEMYKVIRNNLVAKRFDPEMLKEIQEEEKSQKMIES